MTPLASSFRLENAPRIRLLLEYLRSDPEGFPRNELIEACDIPQGSATYLLRTLEAKGIVHIAEQRRRGRPAHHHIIPTDRILDDDLDAIMADLFGATRPAPSPKCSVTEIVENIKSKRKLRAIPAPSPKSKAPSPTLEKAKEELTPKLTPKLSPPLQKIIVSRHDALVTYMREIGLVDETIPVFPHAGELMVEGKHVYGNLPLHLAARAARLTVVPLRNVPHHLRGTDLPLEAVRVYAGEPRTYEVRQVGTEI